MDRISVCGIRPATARELVPTVTGYCASSDWMGAGIHFSGDPVLAFVGRRTHVPQRRVKTLPIMEDLE